MKSSITKHVRHSNDYLSREIPYGHKNNYNHMKIRIILILFSLLYISSCTDLDVPPPNVIGDETLMTSESGMDVYIAGMYSKMPFEDFKYMAQWGVEYNSWLGSLGIEGTGEALNRDGICSAYTGEIGRAHV